MMTELLMTVAAIAVFSLSAEDLTRYVDPFVGTAGTGHTFPGACLPFGMVQASPDTGTETWDYCSGYRYSDESIFGFSQTHLNGTGGRDLGDWLILPFRGEMTADFREPIDKSSERAEPGYYAVTLKRSGIRAEVTVSEHGAVYRFTPDRGGVVRLLVDGQWGIVNPRNPATFVRKSVMGVTCAHSVEGCRTTENWNRRECSFVMEADRDSIRWSRLAKRDPRERGERYVLDFAVPDGASLQVKIGLSRNRVEDARRNLEREIPGWSFEDVRKRARQSWQQVLARAVAEGSEDQKKNWYTALYHLCLQPNNIADVGERPFYSTFSCWDTFRAAAPLYTLLFPEHVENMVKSMLGQGTRTGYLPIWCLWGSDNQCMIGTHSVPMIVDAYLKRTMLPITGIDWAAAYEQIRESLLKPHKGRRKENWDVYDRYGYYPYDLVRGESVSRTLECAYDDWCAEQMARELGRQEDVELFHKRSEYWRNVFDVSIGMVRGKDSRGSWREPYNPYALGHGADLDNDFTEGNAFQYTWHVMQNPMGLVDMMGGRNAFLRRLDELFLAPDKVEGAGCVLDVTGLIGQYVHGNEPSHHVIYFYPLLGARNKAAERIREVCEKFYAPKPDGLCGNDDCGQMSAWYLFSCMGFYPFNPCGGEYVLGVPQLRRVVLTVNGGRRLIVEASRCSGRNKYVGDISFAKTASASEVVHKWERETISHAALTEGGILRFEMRACP